MPIDPISDRLLPLKEAVDLFPRRRKGTRVNIATLWRWMTAGARGVVLETVRVGNQNYTTEQAIRDFIAAQSRPTGAPIPRPADSAIKRLERLGL
jgi:hypothetical protein